MGTKEVRQKTHQTIQDAVWCTMINVDDKVIQ